MQILPVSLPARKPQTLTFDKRQSGSDFKQTGDAAFTTPPIVNTNTHDACRSQ
jgi:hypothetical protein